MRTLARSTSRHGRGLLCVLWVLFCFAGLSAEAADAHPIGNEPQLFVDDLLVASKSGVMRRAHACEKLSSPVLEPEMAWEREGDDQRVYLYGTVLRDAQTGQFRMWYNRLDAVLYATSADGLHWDRPELGLVDLNGSSANNCLLLGMHSPSVVYNPNASDPYVMLGRVKEEGKGCWVAHSPDGVHWTFYPKNPVFESDDTCTLLYDAKAGEYLAFHKDNVELRGHKRRTVFLSVSRDLQEWSESKLVMAPDEIDDAQVRREGGRCAQFYNMSTFPYGGQFLGFVTHFRVMGPPVRKGPKQSNDDGPIDVQLVHSRDGRAWERCEDRSPVIPNGPHAYDAGCILGVANGVVTVGDEVWTYYTAITTTHGGFIPEKRVTIALAKWRLDGFVSLDAGTETGLVQTVPIEPEGDRLVVNAESGHMTVAVLDAEGSAIPGYAHEDCKDFSGDSVRHAVSWKSHETLPETRPLRLEFRMRDTRLYSYTILPR